MNKQEVGYLQSYQPQVAKGIIGMRIMSNARKLGDSSVSSLTIAYTVPWTYVDKHVQENCSSLTQVTCTILNVVDTLILATHLTTKPNFYQLLTQKFPSSFDIVYTSVKIQSIKYASNIAQSIIESRVVFSKTKGKMFTHESRQICDWLAYISTCQHRLVSNYNIDIPCSILMNEEKRGGDRWLIERLAPRTNLEAGRLTYKYITRTYTDFVVLSTSVETTMRERG